MKKILLIASIVIVYLYAVTPTKKHKKYEYHILKHHRLKVVFAGKLMMLLFLLLSCEKNKTKPIEKQTVNKYCNDFAGIWHCDDVKDSLVIDVLCTKNDTTYYKSNIKMFNSVLKHKCPYKWKDDFLRLTIDNYEYIFRYQH